MTTLNRCLGKHWLTITAVESPVFADDEESTRVWFETAADPRKEERRVKKRWRFPVVCRKRLSDPIPILTALKQCTNSSTVEELVGKQVTAKVIVDGGEITISHIRTF